MLAQRAVWARIGGLCSDARPLVPCRSVRDEPLLAPGLKPLPNVPACCACCAVQACARGHPLG